MYRRKRQVRMSRAQQDAKRPAWEPKPALYGGNAEFGPGSLYRFKPTDLSALKENKPENKAETPKPSESESPIKEKPVVPLYAEPRVDEAEEEDEWEVLEENEKPVRPLSSPVPVPVESKVSSQQPSAMAEDVKVETETASTSAAAPTGVIAFALEHLRPSKRRNHNQDAGQKKVKKADKKEEEETKTEEPENPLIKALLGPKMVQTENGSYAFNKTNSPVLDLFFNGMLRSVPEATVLQLVSDAWTADPKRTLQVLMHARDCRGGKGEREVVTHAMLWLRVHKPRTYLRNLAAFVSVGYYKDLVKLAARAAALKLHPLGSRDWIELEVLAAQLKEDWEKLQLWKQRVEQGTEEEVVEDEEDTSTKKQQKGKNKTNKTSSTEMDMDEKQPSKGKKVKKVHISLAAKWAPNEGGAFDKKYRLARRLCALMFPGQAKGSKLYRVALRELRAHAVVVEQLMCEGRWSEIRFETVPGRAHQNYKGAFRRHEAVSYSRYLAKVTAGKAKIKVGGFDAVKVIEAMLKDVPLPDGMELDGFERPFQYDHNETDEEQWKAMLGKLRASGPHLTRALSMVDTSGSMSSQSYEPLAAAVMLGIATASLTEGPFHKKLLTFSSEPAFEELKGNSLYEQVKRIQNEMQWGQSTNLLAAFELILKTAVDNSVPPQFMPQTVFIYSDMAFDQAIGDRPAPDMRPQDFKGPARLFTGTTQQQLQLKYAQAGYEMPQIVYWNLRGDMQKQTLPVSNDKETGVALLSGYSPQLLKIFSTVKTFTPEVVLDAAVGKYEVVVDPLET